MNYFKYGLYIDNIENYITNKDLGKPLKDLNNK